ncbi:MAG: aldo/keto reductase [Actinomycetota bacterium]|nr:aldo/keto reductase [Actinomycetota bacterium]
MRKTRLGSQGPEIAAIGYGSWEAGGGLWGEVPDDRTIAAIRASADAGSDWVDSAEIYGRGRSEELVGQALPGRDDVMVFTKVAPRGPGSGFRPNEVKAAARASLRRLGRDVIELYQLHWPDDSVPIEETWGAMAELVDDGLVRWIGVSNFDRDLIERCESVRHVDSLQPHFSMLHREGRDELFPFCAANGTGIICYGPLAYGLLTGVIDEETEFADDDWRGKPGGGYYDEFFAPEPFERNLAIVRSLKPIAERLGIELSQLALAWVFHQEGVTGAIAGSRSEKHVRENVRAGDVELSADDLDEVDEVLGSDGRD